MNKSHPFGLGWVPDLPDHRDKTFSKAVTDSRVERQAVPKPKKAGAQKASKTSEAAAHTFQGWQASQCALEEYVDMKHGERVRLNLELAKAAAFGAARSSRQIEADRRTPRPVSRPLLLDEPPPVSSLPPKVDLRPFLSPIEQQEQISSCTAHAIIGLVEYLQIATRAEYVDASRLFLYKATRNLLQWSGDSGAYLRETIKALRLFGVCPERYWEYDAEKLDDEPSTFCYSFAANYKSMSYYRMENLTDIKRSLAQGYPVALGFTCFESIFLDRVRRNGVISYPQKNERNSGGHAVLAVGYIEAEPGTRKVPGSSGSLIIRNSWGPNWGEAGYGYLPYAFIQGNAEDALPLSDDYWTMTRMEMPDLSDTQAAPFTMDSTFTE
ncbi:MAG TPA: C1 family peptidase [Blastocatellia bacterium]|nr:C1 family peptidase [Blastocatellia bacterium]